MGFTPDQVDKMTPWEFMACVDGYGLAQGRKPGPSGRPMDEDRLRELGIEGF